MYGTFLSNQIASSTFIANKKTLKKLIFLIWKSDEKVLVLTYEKCVKITFTVFQIPGTGELRQVILSVAYLTRFPTCTFCSSKLKQKFSKMYTIVFLKL